jgi:hypothetical protein
MNPESSSDNHALDQAVPAATTFRSTINFGATSNGGNGSGKNLGNTMYIARQGFCSDWRGVDEA